MTKIDEILKKYGLTRDTARQYIDAITRMNQTKAAEELGVSRDTIHRCKNAFADMTPIERAQLTASLAQDEFLDKATEG